MEPREGLWGTRPGRKEEGAAVLASEIEGFRKWDADVGVYLSQKSRNHLEQLLSLLQFLSSILGFNLLLPVLILIFFILKILLLIKKEVKLLKFHFLVISQPSHL